jgi:hypothetical protein
MKRSEKVGSRSWPYRSVVRIENTLDALDWCKSYQGQGRFHFKWLVDRYQEGESEIIGEFHFTDDQDHMMFTMQWVR